MDDAAPRRRDSIERPHRELIRLAWPMAISMISYSVMTLVSTLFVSRLGAEALAGVGLGSIACFAVLCFGWGFLRSVKILVAQADSDHREVRAYLGAGLAAGLGIGLAAIVVGEAVAQLLPLIAASREVGEHARSYMRIRILAAPMVMLYVAVREHRYGRGDARTPMYAVLAGNLVNATCDWLFILVMGLGVQGAAYATILGHLTEACLLGAVQSSYGFDVRGTRIRHLRALAMIGLPTGVQFVIETGAFAVLAGMIASMSVLDMAAHQIALQVIHFASLPNTAMAEAASVLAGRAIGAGRKRRVVHVARVATMLAGAYAGFCGLILLFGGELIAASFAVEHKLVVIAATLLALGPLYLLFDAANIVARGALRGAGDVRYPAVVGFVTSWLLTPPTTWILGKVMGMGALGGWIGMCAQTMLAATLMWSRLRGRGFYRAASRSLRQLGRERRAHPLSHPPSPNEPGDQGVLSQSG